jgi:hypothetical protein
MSAHTQKYVVTVREFQERVITVKASSPEQAKALARQLWIKNPQSEAFTLTRGGHVLFTFD